MAVRKKKATPKIEALDAEAVAGGAAPGEVTRVGSLVEAAGGAVLATYREPLQGNWVVFASLPLEKVEPTPYQRELSEPHVKRLSEVIPKVGRFLDPVVAVPHDGIFWTPNGRHRLAAMRELGAKAIVALVVPEPEVALRILALNTEKAHNLKDKSVEVARMERALAVDALGAERLESELAFEFEEAAYATLGIAYEERARLAGAVLLPVLKRIDAFFDEPIRDALKIREARAQLVLELDDAVGEAAARLKEAGLQSPYLKAFVAARINPLRFRKKAEGTASFDATMSKMIAAARRMDASRIRSADLAGAGGAPEE